MTIAGEEHAQMIVVGNRGMAGASRVLGSVPNRVPHHAPCACSSCLPPKPRARRQLIGVDRPCDQPVRSARRDVLMLVVQRESLAAAGAKDR
jgi:Universal stress protein family